MHLLLIDDETSLLNLLGQSLIRKGHTIESADCVTDARLLVSRPFDAAVIDWTLPDGTGLDIGRAFLEANQTASVIFTSGYPLDISLVPPSLRSRIRLLQKPFMPHMLVEALASVTVATERPAVSPQS